MAKKENVQVNALLRNMRAMEIQRLDNISVRLIGLVSELTNAIVALKNEPLPVIVEEGEEEKCEECPENPKKKKGKWLVNNHKGKGGGVNR